MGAELFDTAPTVVADIGGTNARFGLVTGIDAANRRIRIESKRQYSCADFPDFNSVLSRYCESLDEVRPAGACIAIAGPVNGSQVRMTNLDWSVSCSEARRAFNLERFNVINDYTALSYATLFLGDEALSTVCQGSVDPKAPRCIIGPGTGLGVAAIVPCDDHWVVLSGEGGHVTLASTGPYETRLIQHMSASRGMIRAEKVLSGPGIRRLYKAICEVEGYPDAAALPAEITAAARAGSDPAAVKAFEVFCRLLGGLVGDMVLAFGAKGGVYLAGGILPRVEPILKSSDFESCLKDKGVMSPYLEDISVVLITAKDAALLGAAAWAFENMAKEQA